MAEPMYGPYYHLAVPRQRRRSAIQSAQGAIVAAHKLGWDLAPLEQRLAAYRSGKPWNGQLLAF